MTSTRIRVALLWKLQAQFAGLVLAQRELEGLELLPRRFDRSPSELVAAGDADFAVAAPAHLLALGAAADRLVLVALFMRRSPIRLAAVRGRTGERLAGLERARVGSWEGEDLEVRAMLLANGVPLDDVTFVPMGDEVSPLVRGEVDLLQATTYEELPRLARELGDARALIAHSPERYGVDVAKDGLVVRADLLEEEPALVAAVVGAAARGWKAALADREAALSAVLADAPDLDPEEQREQLDRIADLFDPAAPFGRPDVSEIERAARVWRLVGRETQIGAVRVDASAWETAVRA